jgi:hypothetical protein
MRLSRRAQWYSDDRANSYSRGIYGHSSCARGRSSRVGISIANIPERGACGSSFPRRNELA